MNSKFYVCEEFKLWIIHRNGVVYAEHEEKQEALEEAMQLAARYNTEVVVENETELDTESSNQKRA